MPTGSWKEVGAGGGGCGTGFDGGSALAGALLRTTLNRNRHPVDALRILSARLSLASGDRGGVDVLGRESRRLQVPIKMPIFENYTAIVRRFSELQRLIRKEPPMASGSTRS
jgi:hypothetical protein